MLAPKLRNRSRRARLQLSFAAVMALLTTPLAAVATAAASPSGTVDVTLAPVMVAKTTAGPVGYREVGHGTPLVLIMGFDGTMDAWSPSFVDALAANHRVIVFDNAGVGKTAPISDLSIEAMAGQTSALISALGLAHPAVLGWSMGGMIAQALAVLHPAQVDRLVLAATQAGTGKAAPVPPAAQAALLSGGVLAILSVLFPPGHAAAARAYALSLLQYPGLYGVTEPVRAAQLSAVEGWLAGQDKVGHNDGAIAAPTLVADGTSDALDPVANDHQLAGLIPGAQLALYPGAGHAFWSQDQTEFVPRLESSLGASA
jgi:pimeloyl-ACP methyl ester carboxylesterase